MGSNPLIKSTVTGIIMQALMVVIGKYIPAIAAMPNFYAICGTALATLTGSMVGRGSAASQGAIATNGAIAGGASSIVGGILAVVTGQWPGFQIVQLGATRSPRRLGFLRSPN